MALAVQIGYAAFWIWPPDGAESVLSQPLLGSKNWASINDELYFDFKMVGARTRTLDPLIKSCMFLVSYRFRSLPQLYRGHR
jgi:hypothetical protein